MVFRSLISHPKLTQFLSLPFADEIAERLSENYKPGKVDDAGQDLQLKLENIIQSTNNLDFSDFTKINNDKNNNDSHSAKLVDSKQEVSSEQEDSGLKSESTDSASVSSQQSASVSSISADQSPDTSEQSAVASGELNDSEPVQKQTGDSVNTSDLMNDLSIISSSSTNPSSANSSFDSASLNTSDYVSLKSLPTKETTAPSAPTDSPDSSSSSPGAPVLSSSPKQSKEKNGAPNEPTKTVKRDNEPNVKDASGKPAKESPSKAEPAKNAKQQIKDDSFKKDRSSFFPSLPKSSSAETISKLKSNISSVSTNSSNLFNKTISTISNNLLTNITNKNRNRAADAKKQQAAAANQPHRDTRKQEVNKQSDKQVNALSAAHTPNGKQPVRAQTIDEERIMNEHAEDYGSLNCDHEPGLEFDDSELEQAAKLEDGKRVLFFCCCTISLF